jgi:hypothetical protein
MTVYSIGFMSGFFTGKGSLPLVSDGDEMSLTLTKGDDFQGWLTDDTGVISTRDLGDEIPMGVMNRRKVHELIDAWLDGVEFKA